MNDHLPKCEMKYESADMQTRTTCQADAHYNVLPNHADKSGNFVCERHLESAIAEYDGKCYVFRIQDQKMVYPVVNRP